MAKEPIEFKFAGLSIQPPEAVVQLTSGERSLLREMACEGGPLHRIIKGMVDRRRELVELALSQPLIGPHIEVARQYQEQANAVQWVVQIFEEALSEEGEETGEDQ